MPDGTAARRGRRTAQDVDRHVGARMRERRIMLGLTQQQAGELIGVTSQQAHKYETGVNRINVGRLHRLAEALGVEPAYFFEGLGAEPVAEPRRRATLDLARHFTALPSRRLQEALAELARALDEG